jgi:hypothetical protein
MPSWLPVVTTLLGVAAGAVLTHFATTWRELKNRERIRRGHFDALAAEIRIGGDLMAGYIRDDVLVPAYRVPLLTYQASLPPVLAEGILTEEDASALFRFRVNAEAFNRSIDLAERAFGNEKEVARQARRARTKARKGAPGSAGLETHYDRAMAVMAKHLPARSLQRPELRMETDEEQ